MGEPTNAGDTGATDAGASKTPQADTGSVPEPVILEEHVVAPAARQTPSASPQPPAPLPAAPTPAAAAAPGPAPSVPPPAPEPVSLIPKPAPTIAPQPAATSQTPPQPVSPPIVATPAGANTSMIANMLQMIKLPERNTAPREEPKRTYDTSLSIDPKSEAAAEAARAEALKKAEAAAHAITESLPTSAGTPVDDVRALHTLKDDLQEVVRDKKISLVRAVALEEEKRHHGSPSEERVEMNVRTQKRTRYGLFIVVVFFLLGALAIGAVLYVMAERTQKAAAPITAAVLFSEQSAPLPVDNLAPADLRREIGNARGSSLTLGAILEIIPVMQKTVDGTTGPLRLTFAEFIEKIGAHPPAELTRALADQFFIGLHTVDENAPVIVIPVVSYELAFAAMLEWEARMNNDLSPIFTPVPMQKMEADGTIGMRRFEDTVLRNYDVRALKDDSGTIQLYYSFPTRNVLIIAESSYSFSEVLSRLRADRKL